MKPLSAAPETLVREELAIRFVNTVAWRRRDPNEDRAASPEMMLKWMLDAKLLDRAAFESLAARWQKSRRDARDFFEAAVELREAIYRLLLAKNGGEGGRDSGREMDAKDVATLNRQLAQPLRGIRLAPFRNALKWRSERGAAARSLLNPIAWSAVSVLTGPRAERVKQCQDERGCGWLFIDESRAQNRRWCSMGNCGNLAKSRRHFRRIVSAAASARPASRRRSL